MAQKIAANANSDAPKEGRRRLLLNLGYSVFARVRERIAADHDWKCIYCGREVIVGPDGGDRLATIDHKIPLSRGGSWKRFNLTCACKGCNGEKGDLTAEEFMDRGVRRCRSATSPVNASQPAFGGQGGESSA
jgi:5-methylcytosine-specific restriction endonuclease McrA